MNVRPATSPVRPLAASFSGLPDLSAINRLRRRKQFVCWNYVFRPPQPAKDGKPGPAGKWDKPPLHPKTDGGCSATDSANWAEYDTAAETAKRLKLAGVGFALSPDDGLTGIDLDKVRDPATGKLDAWAVDILKLAETYAEVSPSGTGIRMFAEDKITVGFKCDPVHVEVYVTGRYLTLTGQHVAGTPTEIRPAPQTLKALKDREETIRSKLEGEKPQTNKSPKARCRSGNDFFGNVNDAALQNLSKWVPNLFQT